MRPKTSKISKNQSVQEPVIADIKTKTAEDMMQKMITGDDLLIEYTGRVIKVLRLFKDVDIDPEQKDIIEKFINHPAWISVDLLQTVPT